MEQAATKLSSGEYGLIGIILAVVILGFVVLLKEILKAWTGDRSKVTELLSDFRVTLEGVRVEIANLAKVQTRIMEHLEDEPRTPARRG